MSYIIRAARPDDCAVIAEFNSRLAAETEGTPLDLAIVGPGVERVLGDPKLGSYWVAEADAVVIGQLLVTYEWSDWRNGMLWWLQSVYVHQDHRRGGVFTSLYRHVEALARAAQDVAGIRLYLEQDNARAQRSYEKLGMHMTAYRVMQVEFRPDYRVRG